jgi:transcriptional regulator with XRE-family HTH domain
MASQVVRDATSRVTARNIKRLRMLKGWSLADLALRLSYLESVPPFTPNMLNKIELGKRKTDVDDLIAIAIALEASPLAILLPWSGDRVSPNPQGGVWTSGANAEITVDEAWKWATGDSYPPSLGRDSTRLIGQVSLMVTSDREALGRVKAELSPESFAGELDRAGQELLAGSAGLVDALKEEVDEWWPAGLYQDLDPEIDRDWSPGLRARYVDELQRLFDLTVRFNDRNSVLHVPSWHHDATSPVGQRLVEAKDVLNSLHGRASWLEFKRGIKRSRDGHDDPWTLTWTLDDGKPTATFIEHQPEEFWDN